MNDEEMFEGVPPFSQALAALAKFATNAMAALPKDGELYAQGDKAIRDITLAALRDLVMGKKQQDTPVPNNADIERQLRGHDPYSRS